MSEKLKTLKDLKINLSVIAPHLNWKSEVVEYEVARQEAIKWIRVRKEWLKDKNFGKSTEEQIETFKYGVMREIAVLTFFFNITKEDLK